MARVGKNYKKAKEVAAAKRNYLLPEAVATVAKTAKDEGLIIPVVITVYSDRSYTFITKTPPVAVLIKRAVGIAKGSGEPNKNKVGTITQKQVEEIAKMKLPDLNAESLQAAVNTVKGTARSMGVDVV